MRLPGLKTIRNSGRRLRARFCEHALILGYHRVTPYFQDPYHMCVTTAHFLEQMQVLNQRAEAISLTQLVEDLRNGQIRDQKVVVTFDDGYSDILEHANPVLEQYGIPATVFVITGLLGEMFWWDRLQAALIAKPGLEVNFFRKAGIKFLKNKGNGSSQEPILLVYRMLKEATLSERKRIISEMEAEAGIDELGGERTARSMSADEITQLAFKGLVEFGSHSASHPWLTKLSHHEQHEEISKSKSDLEEIIDREVTSFSYPNGSFSKITASIVEKSGFNCACTSIEDVVRGKSDLYNLPRRWVPDLNGADFERWLSLG